MHAPTEHTTGSTLGTSQGHGYNTMCRDEGVLASADLVVQGCFFGSLCFRLHSGANGAGESTASTEHSMLLPHGN